MTDHTDMGGARRGGAAWWRIAPWIGAGGLLLTPLIAMQFTEEVQWTASDFVVMGVLMAVPLGAFELAVRTSPSIAFRAGVAVAMVATFLLVWINLAVGIIGSEDNPANLMFFGILALGVAGAFVADFRAAGLARALLVVAAAQGLVGVVALAARWGEEGANWPQVIVVMAGLFATLWLGAAWLFHKAARNQAS